MENWKSMLDEALKENGESWGDVEANTMTDEEMNEMFDTGYVGVRGCAFTVWTKNSVYFPLSDVGYEFVGRVSRNPDSHYVIRTRSVRITPELSRAAKRRRLE